MIGLNDCENFAGSISSNRMENIDEILEKVQQGDLPTFSFLYNNYYPGLCRYAFLMLNDRFLAEETVQDVFINVRKTRKRSFLQEDSLKKCLYRTTYNKCVKILKKRKSPRYRISRLLSAEVWKIWSEKYGYDNNFAEKLEKAETYTLVERLVGQLPKQCREIFRLSRYKEKTHTEIAKYLDLSESTVRVQLHIAIRKIEAKVLE